MKFAPAPSIVLVMPQRGAVGGVDDELGAVHVDADVADVHDDALR